MKHLDNNTADGIIAVSQQMKADVIEAYGVDSNKITVIHNGIDPEFYKPTFDTNLLMEYGINPAIPFVLFVGRITRQKGISQLIEACYIFNVLDTEKTSEILLELEEDLREKILETLSAKEIAEELDEMDTDDAANIIGELSQSKKEEVISELEDVEHAKDIVELLRYDEMKSASKTIQLTVNPNTSNYDITYHKLEFTVDPSIYSVAGKVTTTYTALSDMNSINFDLANELIVASVKQGTTNLKYLCHYLHN